MKNKELKDFIHNNVYQNTSTGYVLTPSELAFEMIQTLPKSVFKSESTTFLDPICKSGTFLFEIIEELYENGHSIKNIEGRIFTIDGNSHSLNVANSSIKKILNKLSGSFKIDYKYEFIERYYNRLISSISKGKYTTFDDFLSIIIVDKTNKELMKELQKNISEFIEKYEKVSRLESKLFGEVFTPRKLIDEMLDTLPEDVWKNKDLKWLDPAVGIGNFPAAILDRLMIGLSYEFKDELERKKHILEEMLHFCDISIKNLFLLYKLFDCNNEFKLNVYRGSFLTEDFNTHMKEVWKIEGFDVVVGNPPYNENNSNSNEKLYFKFINKSFIYLKESGILLYVLPDDCISYIINTEKYYISYINSDNIVGKYFKGIGTKILYFLSYKERKYENTTFVDSKCTKSINIMDKTVILMNIDDTIIVDKIVKKSDERFNIRNAKHNGANYRIRFNNIKKNRFSLKGIDLICVDSKLLNKHKLTIDNDFDRDIFKYKVIDHSSDRVEFYSNTNFDNDCKRVCINTIGNIKPIYDKIGEYVLSDGFIFIEVQNDSEAENILSILNSKIIKYLQIVLTHNTKNKCRVLSYLPKLDTSVKLSDDDLYQHFNLTQEEIEFIENTIKD